MEHIYFKLQQSKMHKVAEEMLDFQKLLSNEEVPQDENDLRIKMNFTGTDDEFEKLSEKVNLNKIYNYDDVRVSKYIPGKISSKHLPLYDMPSPGNKLKSYQKSLRLRTKKKPLFLKNELNNRSAYYEKLKKYNDERDLVPIKEGRISIRFYKPFHYVKTPTFPKFVEEIQCLTSQLLTEIRDVIYCDSNKFKCFDISDNPNIENPIRDVDPGTFFISNTFYNDTRNILNPDYSENILEWMKTQPNFNPDNYTKAKMEETKISDLNFCMGFPQVYMHNGNCEHVFTFSHVEMISTVSDEERAIYPIKRSLGPDKIIMCDICGRQEREYVAIDSLRDIQKYSFLCKVCLLSYNYIDGEKVGQFKLYRINPDAIIPIYPNKSNNVQKSYPELTNDNAHLFVNTNFKYKEPEEELDVYDEGLDLENISKLGKKKKAAINKPKPPKKLKRKPRFSDLTEEEKKNIQQLTEKMLRNRNQTTVNNSNDDDNSRDSDNIDVDDTEDENGDSNDDEDADVDGSGNCDSDKNGHVDEDGNGDENGDDNDELEFEVQVVRDEDENDQTIVNTTESKIIDKFNKKPSTSNRVNANDSERLIKIERVFNN